MDEKWKFSKTLPLNSIFQDVFNDILCHIYQKTFIDIPSLRFFDGNSLSERFRK